MTFEDNTNRTHKDTSDSMERIKFKPVPTDADAVYDRIWQRIQNDKIISIGISPVWKYISVAASIALLIVSSVLFSEYTKKRDMAFVEVVAIPGTKVKVVLPDSSMVWLNSKAKIRYPHRFSAENRMVEFSGEGLFKVKSDPRQSFIVNAEGLKIKVLGTEFNVCTHLDSPVVETTLLSGKVALFGAENQTGEADATLAPNQQALYDKRDGSIDILKVRALSYSSWVSGLFVFEKNTLEEIATSLERAFDVKIHIESEKLKQERLTARFVHQETLDEILSILRVSAHYRYKKEKSVIFIYEK